MKLKNKIAIVTGASSGMGKEIAFLFAKEGATVYAVARRIERLKELAESAKDFEGKIIPHKSDLTQKGAADRMIENALGNSGRLDILVNNAGVMDDFSPVGDVKDEMLERVFNLNLFTMFYSMRKAIEVFRKQGGGNIVNIASISGLYGSRAGAVYTAAKHGVVGLTKNTGYMYAKENIRCNVICPGGVDTEIGKGEFMKNVNAEAMGIIMPNLAGNPRSGSPTEIATIALFLASDDSSLINGQAIVADSGWTAF